MTAAELAELAGQIRAWPFHQYVLTNVESSLASTDLPLMRSYAGLVQDVAVRERLGGLIEAEWQRTQTMLEKLRGGRMDDLCPRFTKTIAVRAEALPALHHQQIGLLSRWRALHAAADQANGDALLPEVLLSINAIASGLRTTG